MGKKEGLLFKKGNIDYIDKNFKKVHGKGIDDTNVEVYYYNENMIK